jgi:C1A family cysteine protease
MALELTTLQHLLETRKARWTAAENSISSLDPKERRKCLGYVPGPNDLTLKHREDLAKVQFQASKLALTAVPPLYPPAYDLRNVSGANFITAVKNQYQCGSCVAFGTAAAIEGTWQFTQRNPNSGIDLSEAHIFFCYAHAAGRVCGCNNEENSGWWPYDALPACTNGVAAETSYPYPAEDPCADHDCSGLQAGWQAMAKIITGWHSVNSPNDMKTWLSTRGPLITTMSVYEDFWNYQGNVYHYVSGQLEGGHCIGVVGYDDNQQCWICKNSWGTQWGLAGFFLIGYGECGIDATMYAVEGVAACPIPPAAMASS